MRRQVKFYLPPNDNSKAAASLPLLLLFFVMKGYGFYENNR